MNQQIEEIKNIKEIIRKNFFLFIIPILFSILIGVYYSFSNFYEINNQINEDYRIDFRTNNNVLIYILNEV